MHKPTESTESNEISFRVLNGKRGRIGKQVCSYVSDHRTPRTKVSEADTTSRMYHIPLHTYVGIEKLGDWIPS